MDANSIDAAEKASLLVQKQLPAKSNPPKTSAPIIEVPNLENDSVTLSQVGKHSSKQVNPGPDVDSAAVQGELGIVSSSRGKVNPQRKLSVTDDKQVILKIIDPKTKDVIKQLPAKEQVKLREIMRNMVENFLPPKKSG